ncbi:MAG: exosome complex exonuclease Rrp41 [Candidatus Bathyarchaeia archaeon]
MLGTTKLIDQNGVRIDGRRTEELRPIKMEVGILANANGSAYIEHGKNKILAAVYGPKEAQPKHLGLPDRAVIRCRFHMAPFSVEERKSPAPSRREIELSKVIREALEPVIFSEYYPKAMIDVFVEVLQSDGGSRCAGVTAASLALADAGIPLRDLVAACAVGKIEGQLIVDVSDEEDKQGEADLPMALIPSTGKISLLQMDGHLTSEEFEQLIGAGTKACLKIYELQRLVLKQKYLGERDVVEKTSAEM